MREHRALNAILEPGGLTTLFQPIVRFDGEREHLAGFECLSRGPKGTNLESAKVLFEYVRLKREETLVDRACIAAVLAAAPKHEDILLALNVHASTLSRDQSFVDFLLATAESNAVSRNRLMVEIVEHAPTLDSVGLTSSLDHLRASGVHIALDDVGLGQANFKMILDVRPEFLKLDRYFVESCDVDRDRQAVIASLASLAAHFGADVIAEGVESKMALATLQRFGIRYVQGYLLAEPLTADAARELVSRSL
jgi:EAL domain-containing protein (putative c-di-GMP-specific phosphodiesterase class I)